MLAQDFRTPAPEETPNEFAAYNRFVVEEGTAAQAADWLEFLAQQVSLSCLRWLDLQQVAEAAVKRGDAPRHVRELERQVDLAEDQYSARGNMLTAMRIRLEHRNGCGREAAPDADREGQEEDETAAKLKDEDNPAYLLGVISDRARGYLERCGESPTHILVPRTWEPNLRREIAKVVAGMAGIPLHGGGIVGLQVAVGALGDLRIDTLSGEVQVVWVEHVPQGVPICYRPVTSELKRTTSVGLPMTGEQHRRPHPAGVYGYSSRARPPTSVEESERERRARERLLSEKHYNELLEIKEGEERARTGGKSPDESNAETQGLPYDGYDPRRET